MKVSIDRLSDGALVLDCGTGGMETDLVFASGAACDGDPVLVEQLLILEYIVSAVEAYNETLANRPRSPQCSRPGAN